MTRTQFMVKLMDILGDEEFDTIQITDWFGFVLFDNGLKAEERFVHGGLIDAGIDNRYGRGDRSWLVVYWPE